MTYVDQYAVATNDEFRNRIRMAIIDAAKDIYTEDPGTSGHDLRARLAKDIIHSADAWVVPFSFAVAEADQTGSATDAELKTSVASVWNAVAGI